MRDVYDGIDVDDLDRVVLDLPEPWRVVKHAEAALRPGGILLSYLPTIGQVMRLREELDGSSFGMCETLEVLQRTWHVDGQSVRPDHRMVAHTGFLTHARLLATRPRDLEPGMNALDVLILGGIAVAAVCGYRLGFVARALSWAGLAAALVLAVRLIPDLMTALAGATPRGRLLAVIAFVIGLGLLGQALGLAVGALAARAAVERERRATGRSGGRCSRRRDGCPHLPLVAPARVDERTRLARAGGGGIDDRRHHRTGRARPAAVAARARAHGRGGAVPRGLQPDRSPR